MKEPLRLWMPDDKGEMQLTLLEDEHAEQYVYLDDYRELESKLDRETKRGHDLAEQVAALQSKEVCGAAHDDDLIADCPWCKLEAVERFLVGDLRPPLDDPKAVQLAHESAAAVIRRNSETPQ